MSRERVAALASLSDRTLQNYEKGDREPKVSDLMALAKALNTTASYLIGETDEPETMKPSKIDMEEFKELPPSIVEKIFNTPFRASLDPVAAANMTEEEITAAIEETERRIYLYELRDALRKLKAQKS
jgi:transcriptional regulator with XRE-family HTH domain